MDSLDKDFLIALNFTAISEKPENIKDFADNVEKAYKELREIRKSNRKPTKLNPINGSL